MVNGLSISREVCACVVGCARPRPLDDRQLKLIGRVPNGAGVTGLPLPGQPHPSRSLSCDAGRDAAREFGQVGVAEAVRSPASRPVPGRDLQGVDDKL